MPRIEEHKKKIDEVKEQLKTATGYRKNDLKKYLHRLIKELLECEMYMRA